MALFAGCAATPPQHQLSSSGTVGRNMPAEPPLAWKDSGVTGLWEGTSTANCMPFQPDAHRCNAVVKITLRIFQQDSTLSGDYTCAMGTMDCRDTNTTGVIADGAMHGSAIGLRVMMPDGSSCLFNGTPSHNSMSGSYFCMQGGGYIEQGRFQVDRSY
jgi:hypothetical protein